MALSGTKQGTVTKNSSHYTYHLEWSATQNIAENTSTITVKHYWSRKDSYDFDSVGTRRYGITIDGQLFEGSKRMDYSPWPSDTTISTATHTVKHNEDGTKKITISTYANGTASSWGPSNGTGESGDCTASTEITLDQIPRAAQLLDATNFNANTDNPVITYSNPAGNAADVQVSIHDTNGAVAYAGYRSVSKTGTSYTFNLTDAERQALINAVPAGTNSMYVRFYLKTYIGGNLVGDLRYLTRIVTVDRSATITSAPDFTDEDNPTITYNNPNGSTVSDLQVGIFDPAGSVTYAAYRSINKTSGSYTFNLTDSERQALINAIPSGQNGVNVSFYLRTYINGKSMSANIVSRTLTITNAIPSLSCELVDTGTESLKLTNDRRIIIKGFNYVSATMTPVLKKGAKLVGQSISNGDQVANELSGFFNNVESGIFTCSITDSFGQTVNIPKSISLIPYIKLTCDITTDNPTTGGNLSFKISGNYFDNKFGDLGATNDLTLKWRIKENNNNYDSWVAVTPTILDDRYEATINLTGLNYQSAYTVQAIASDLVNKTGVLSLEHKVKSNPVYNWGEDNFDINVPLTVDHIQGNEVFDGQLELGSYDSNTGTKQENASNYRNVNNIAVEPNTSYTIYINDGTRKQVVLFYNKNGDFISETRNVQEDGVFVTPGDAEYINFRCFQADFVDWYQELKIRIVKNSPIKTKTLNGRSIYGDGNLEVGLSEVVLYENQNGTNAVITMNDSAANYEYLEIFYRDQFNGYAFDNVKIPNPNGKNAQLTVVGKNYNDTYMRIATTQITINNNTLTPTTYGVGYTNNTTWYASNEILITRVIGYTKTGFVYVNGEGVSF